MTILCINYALIFFKKDIIFIFIFLLTTFLSVSIACVKYSQTIQKYIAFQAIKNFYKMTYWHYWIGQRNGNLNLILIIVLYNILEQMKV